MSSISKNAEAASSLTNIVTRPSGRPAWPSTADDPWALEMALQWSPKFVQCPAPLRLSVTANDVTNVSGKSIKT